jgi:hypothetical protein
MSYIDPKYGKVTLDATEDVATIRKKILDDLAKLKSRQPNLIDDDIRLYFFNLINNILLDTGIAYRLSDNLNLVEWWTKNIPDCPNEIRPQRIEIFHKGLGINLLYSSYSLTEDAFRQLIRRVKPTACNNGKSAFINIYECLLKELNVTYDESLFKLFRLARNCQHNNGFYFPERNTNSETVTYRGVTYHFPYGQKVQYPNGLPILLILYDISDLYFQMCESEKLKAIDIIKNANAD